jgi:hypothetical protein
VLYAHYQEGEGEDGGGDGQTGGKQFAAAYVDLSRGPETQIWLYSSLEDWCATATSTPTSATTAGVIRGEGSRAGAGSHGDGVDFTREEEEEQKALDLVLALLRRARAIAMTDGALEGGRQMMKVLVGSLHEDIRQRLLRAKKGGVKMEKSPNLPAELEWEFCGKWLFRVEDLPAGDGSLPEGMRWDQVRREDVRVVLDRTSIKRKG